MNPGSPRRADEILAAAGALFGEEGYRNRSMREVAAASGILASSLYRHFPPKEAIAVELVEEYHADLVRAVRESEGASDEKIDTVVLRHVLRCTMLQVGIMVSPYSSVTKVGG